ncbi:MAG: transcriptional regulator [Methylococcales bacterium]|nr:transcriptional regulator [Methylococcales bacterium]
MQLIISVLSNNQTNLIGEILPIIRDCNCNIIEIRSSQLSKSAAAYLLIQGNWNQIAKVETTLEHLRKRLDIKIQTLRPDAKDKEKTLDCIPYSLETISLDKDGVVESITSFLTDRDVIIEEITGSSYQAPYIQSFVFSTKFIILAPPQLALLSLREEFLDFCDQLNIDAILEPIKR